MRLLLDTHVALCSVADRRQIAASVLDMIADRRNQVYVSAISILEIAIKFSLRRRDSPPFGGKDAIIHFERAGFEMLAISAESAAAVEDLPSIHADPFDRALIAQARVSALRLISFDKEVAAYSPDVVTWL